MSIIWMIIIILLLILCFVVIILILSWLNNIQVKRYYKKVASFLQSAKITPPSIFSYNKVTGTYNYKDVEWKCFTSMGTFYKGSFKIEAKMLTNISSSYKGSGIKPTDNTFVRENWVVYYEEQPFRLNADKIASILQELSLATEKYEKDFVIQCLNCGEKIEKDSDKCKKCGWTWLENKNEHPRRDSNHSFSNI